MSDYLLDSFSANNYCEDAERKALEKKYADILDITDKFNRQSVSYQLSKKNAIHSWLKYKEGFSADLVSNLLNELQVDVGATIMDPFMGSGTTALVCQMRGINAIGYDIMPFSEVSIRAKSNLFSYDLTEISTLISEFSALDMPESYSKTLAYTSITQGAFPEDNDRFFHFANFWIKQSHFSEETKNLFTLCVINSLERCSYTVKDGQYLGWDSRSPKVMAINAKRVQQGKKPLGIRHTKKIIEQAKQSILRELRHVYEDIFAIRHDNVCLPKAVISFLNSSVLTELPKVLSDSIDGVITSPPYCNRYDYTRTYALELVYLGLREDTLRKKRQELLSCTVESKSKIDFLKDYYRAIGKEAEYNNVYSIIQNNKCLTEIIGALKKRKEHGDLNNNGIIRMVEGYFTELAFVYAELYRVCKKGAKVFFVNDNVRYGGEVIPVDFLSTNLAENFGFRPIKVYSLKQQKGNSSQQMKKYGRVALRKSITVWEKV